MKTNKLEEDRIDGILRRSLPKQQPLVPEGFSVKVLARLRAQKERQILAKAILAKRAALAGCVVVLGGFVALMLLSPGFMAQTGKMSELLGKVTGAMQGELGGALVFLVGTAAVFLYALYNLVDSLVCDD